MSLTTRFFTTERAGPGPHVHSMEVPTEVSLAGFSGSIQAVIGVDGNLVRACNAVEFTLGCPN